MFAVSAKTAAGVAKFQDYLSAHTSRLLNRTSPARRTRISAPRWEKWRSTGGHFYEGVCNTFDGNAYLRDLAEAIRKNICAADGHTPHLKLFAMGPDGSYGKLSAVGSSGDLTLDHALDAPATALPVVINTSTVPPLRSAARWMRRLPKRRSNTSSP